MPRLQIHFLLMHNDVKIFAHGIKSNQYLTVILNQPRKKEILNLLARLRQILIIVKKKVEWPNKPAATKADMIL